MENLHCLKCGHEMRKEKDFLFICDSCGFNYYLNPVPCNALILENEKREILLVKRKLEPQKEMWDLPGGFITLNETAEESMSREIKEELEIDMEDCSYLSSYVDRYEYKGNNYHTLGLVFYTSITNPKIKYKDDITTGKFFSLDQIPYDKIAFESVKKALREFSDLIRKD